MKKIFFFLLFILLVLLTGCNLFPNNEEGLCTLKVQCDSNGVVTPSGVTISEGEDETLFTITPDEGCIVDKVVTTKGKLIPVRENNTFVVSSSDLTFNHGKNSVEVLRVIIRKPNAFKLVISSLLDIEVYPSGTTYVTEGSDQNIVASFPLNGPDKFLGWIVNGDTLYVQAPLTTTSFTFVLEKIDQDYTIEVLSEKKKVYKIYASVVGGTISSETTSFYEGGTATVFATANSGYEISRLIVNGKDTVPSTSYTAFNSNADHNVKFVFEKGIEWYLCQGRWKSTAIFFGEVQSNPIDEIFDFFTDGTIKRYTNGEYDGYSFRKWKKENNIITFSCTGPYIIATIDLVDVDTLIFHYTDPYGVIITCVYKNIGD